MVTLTFDAPTLSQRDAVTAIGKEAAVRSCDQSFGIFYCWATTLDLSLALWGDSYVARWGTQYTVPIGPQRKELIEAMLEQGITRFWGADEGYKKWMEETFPNRFTFRESRNFDYIYEREALATLRGKKLAAKRNHINAFEQAHQWEIRPITAENMQEVCDFNDWWCSENDCSSETSLEREGCAVRRGLKHFEELGFFGIALYADGKLCAFSYGERLGRDGFCVHVEKADAQLRGAYPMINREMARALPPEIRWINREDDAGDEGLRKAKMSYRPSELLKKYEAEYINE
jgi:hypothetical protein